MTVTWICRFKYKCLEGSLTAWPFSKIKIAGSSKGHMTRITFSQEILIQLLILIYTFVVIILLFYLLYLNMLL